MTLAPGVIDIVIQVQAGAGGTESNDWASMVMNMYKMWAQNHGFQVTVVDEMPGEIAGIKVHFPTFICYSYRGMFFQILVKF